MNLMIFIYLCCGSAFGISTVREESKSKNMEYMNHYIVDEEDESKIILNERDIIKLNEIGIGSITTEKNMSLEIEENTELFTEDLVNGTLSVGNNVVPSLYLKDKPNDPYELSTENGHDAPFNITHPTKVIIHGWMETSSKMWIMMEKYFQNGYYNVVLLDWTYYSFLPYNFALTRYRQIGDYLGQVLLSIIRAEKILVKDIQIVGHALGAHIAGMSGKTIQKQLGKKVGRITGLDPARSMFETPYLVSSNNRLAKEDANFVDVIHTSAGSIGFFRAIGHADFYPNNGKAKQPGCNMANNYICSHGRSYKFFTESINSKKFLATPCDSWNSYIWGKCNAAKRVSMGHFLNITKASGIYYLRTNKQEPFAKG